MFTELTNWSGLGEKPEGFSNRGFRHYQVYGILLLCFAFFLPLSPRIATYLALFLFLNWLLAGWPISYGKHLLKPLPFLFYGFYLFLLLGLFYSDNLAVGLRNMETRMGLFFFPLLFFASPGPDDQHSKRVLWAFLAGCLLASVYSLLGAVMTYWGTGEFSFFYEDLTRYLGFHPTYFGLYISFCLFILLKNLWFSKERLSGRNRFILWGLVAFFFLFLLLLNSRMQLIAFVLLSGGGFIIYAHLRNSLLKGIAVLAVGLCFFGLIIWKVPQLSLRMKAALSGLASDKPDRSSSNLRLQLWNGALSAIKERPVRGYGPGDVQPVLDQYYQDNGLDVAAKKHLNAHNEYLQLSLTHGLPALLWLLLLLFVSLYLGIRHRQALLIFFVLTLMLSFLTESMLAVQRGTLFISFFLSFLVRRVDLNGRFDKTPVRPDKNG
jgi:O-antigen ligase